jgi:hypothetical protein
MDPIQELKILSGVCNRPRWTEYADATTGSNISITGNEKAQIQRERGIKPGTDAWFRLWFSRSYLTNTSPIDLG